MKRLTESVLFASPTGLVNLIIGAVRTKLYAVFIGPFGVGVIGQLSNFLACTSTLNMLGLGIGATKYISESNAMGDKRRIQEVVFLCLSLTTISSMITTFLVIFFSQKASLILFGVGAYQYYIVVAIIGLVFTVLTQIIVGFLNGFKEVKRNAAVSILTSITSLALLLPLLYFWGLTGAVYAVMLAAFSGFFWAVIIFYKAHKEFFRDFSFSIHPLLCKSLLAIGLANLIMGTFDQLVLLFMRSIIIRNFGVGSNGLYQTAYQISQQAVMITFMFLPTYAFPRISELKDHLLINRETDEIVRLSLLLFTPLICLLLLFKKYILLIFLTGDFITAAELLKFQLAGEFLKFLGLVVIIGILQVASVLVWFILGMTWALTLFLSFVTTLPLFGFESIVIAYTISGLIFFSVCSMTMRKYSGYRFSKKNIRLLILSTISISLIVGLSNDTPVFYMIGLALILLWARLAVSDEEFKKGMRLIKESFSR